MGNRELYVNPTEMVGILKEIGYKQIKLLTPSTCIVNHMQKGNKELITKVARYDNDIANWMKESLFTEKKRLERFSGYNNISQIKNFYDFSSRAKESNKVNGNILINPYVLEKEFVPGEKINPKKLSTKEQSQIEEIVRNFHNNGIANLDIAKNNFIRNSERGIVMIDVGGNSNYSKFGFNNNMERDLNDLELMIN